MKLGEDTMRKEMFIAFVLYEYQGHTQRDIFSSASLWAGPSIRSPHVAAYRPGRLYRAVPPNQNR